MAFTCQQHIRAAARPGPTSSTSRRAAVVVRASATPDNAGFKAGLAAAVAALMLASAPTPVLAAPSESAAGPSDKGVATKFLDSLPNIFSPLKKVNEDPFGADRAQAKTVADTKRPIPIPTEQEAVAPEAFPNPSEALSPRPPVLAAAEGDEHQGANAGQFADLDASGRQALIDKQSPAQNSTN